MLRFAISMVVALLLATPTVASAQEQRALVSVSHAGEDSVGQRLAFALREAIRSSAGYRLVDYKEALFRVSLVTLDPDRSLSGNKTAAAVTYTVRNTLPFKDSNPQTWYPIYLTTSIVIAGADRTEDQARGILASLDANIEDYKRDQRR